MTIRTRFAPSPTGYLHIGGVRTALFNWLLVQRLGGQFILRIDDTDAERNKAEALMPILDGFRWLGINWDEGPTLDGTGSVGPCAPYFQSLRGDSYRAAAMQLLESGHAYPDYMTKEELDADKKKADAEKKPYVHRGVHRNTSSAECVRMYREKPTTIRFKVPLGRVAVVDDLICGHCEQRTDLMSDPVILRANSSPLYNFASVVDDIAFKITHVIRAREHLPNTYIQVLIWEALVPDVLISGGGPGLTMSKRQLPRFGHVPVVNEPNSNKKLSKRDMKKFVTEEIRAKLRAIGYTDEQIDQRDDLNPATVAFYREMGYLPEGLVNYLGRLGWSLDDKTEFLTLKEMISHFDLETGIGRINDSPARFDPAKLYWLAGEHMMKLPLAQKVDGCIPYLARANLIAEPVSPAVRAKLEQIIVASGERIKLFSDILPYGGPIFRADPEYAPKAVEKRLKKAGAADLLREFATVLQNTDPFDSTTTDKALHDFCTAKGLKVGDLVHPVRVAVTGVEVGFGLFETLAILGKTEVARRIEMALKL